MIYKIERDDIVNIQGYDDEGFNQNYDLYINTKNIITIEPYFKFLESNDLDINKVTEMGIIINSNLIPLQRIPENDDDDVEENEKYWYKNWDKVNKICDEIVEIMKSEA